MPDPQLAQPWPYRSPKLAVPPLGTTSYQVDITTMSGSGQPFSRIPSVVVSVEGSTTVKAVASQPSTTGYFITLRNEMSTTQYVRFNAWAWDVYAGDITA